jgi:TolA-binding protein
MNSLNVLLLTAVVVFASCSGSVPKEQKLTPEGQREVIKEMEAEIVGSNDISNPLKQNIAKNLVLQYQNYINSNKSDSAASTYLVKAADLSVGLGNYEVAIKYLDKFIASYPTSERLPEILLFKGFIYETHINNYANAVKAYEALRDRFPNHRLAQQAKASIDNLTLSEEELLEKFSKMNNES